MKHDLALMNVLQARVDAAKAKQNSRVWVRNEERITLWRWSGHGLRPAAGKKRNRRMGLDFIEPALQRTFELLEQRAAEEVADKLAPGTSTTEWDKAVDRMANHLMPLKLLHSFITP